MKNYYKLLGVDPSAPVDDIKKAFRREIAKYHRDKVQHLGQEFQAMASTLAADLTEACRVLSDSELRAKYDEGLRAGRPIPEPPPLQWATTPAPKRTEPAQSNAQSPPSEDRRMALLKVREAADAVFGGSESAAAGFETMFISKPKRGLFSKADEGIRLLVRFVPEVDADAIAEVWPLALHAPGEGVPCVLLLGSSLPSAEKLAAGVSEQRRRSRDAGPVLVPVDVRDWEALFPPETPASVRAVIQRLREAKSSAL